MTTTQTQAAESPETIATLRDQFAMAALTAMQLKNDRQYSDMDRQEGLPQKEASATASAAYRYADAMLAART